MKKVECYSRVKLTAMRVESESDLDEWLCGVELEGNVAIAKSRDGVRVKARDINLKFYYGDWIVEDEEEKYKVFSDDEFRERFRLDDGDSLAH